MIHPFILSGGAGTRLWPASRKAFPKPFMPLVDGQTLFGKTIERIKYVPGVAPLTVITNESLRFLTADALYSSQSKQSRLLLEPAGKNTAAAIVLAALDLQARAGSDALMLVLPADHLIANVTAFAEAVQVAAAVANLDWLVTFGITPNAAETGFGYIERDA
ncbi:MAG: sugar phosphate nucleotidyltransferase, partial [Halothiobacillus sp.]|nr:sugar phosphate nucleotidyltransferase [Halothiobacillus sp.]